MKRSSECLWLQVRGRFSRVTHCIANKPVQALQKFKLSACFDLHATARQRCFMGLRAPHYARTHANFRICCLPDVSRRSVLAAAYVRCVARHAWVSLVHLQRGSKSIQVCEQLPSESVVQARTDLCSWAQWQRQVQFVGCRLLCLRLLTFACRRQTPC